MVNHDGGSYCFAHITTSNPHKDNHGFTNEYVCKWNSDRQALVTSGLNTPREWRTKINIFPVAFSSWPVVENHQPLSYQSTWIIAKSRAFINVGKTVFEQLKTNQPEHSWIAKRNPPKMPARFSPSSGFPLREINKIIFSKDRYLFQRNNIPPLLSWHSMSIT